MEKVYKNRVKKNKTKKKNRVIWTKTEIHYRMPDITEDLDSALRIF